MADTLVIVESPTKAKTIGKYLGSKYIVKSSVGHVRDLPKSQMGVDVTNNFEPKYITIRGKGDVLKGLKDAAKKVKKVYLAADPDREGEAIAWHLAQYLGLDLNQPIRVVFNEITKDAIKEAFKHPRHINMDLVNAQQARRILDRLVGYNISPILWKKVRKGLSAGRVQSVTVKLIMDREREIQEFIPEEYWTIASTLISKGKDINAKFYGYGDEKVELHSEDDVAAVLKRMKNKPYVVQKVTKRERKRNPSPPFITSSLQQEAARKLNFRTSKTMRIAQELYEGIDVGNKEGAVGLITYMRTDSTRLSETAQNEAKEYILEKFGPDYVLSEPRTQAKNENAQDAHEAIRPTGVMRTPDEIKEFLSRDQLRLYRLIWERFLASQMSSAVLDTMSVDIDAGGVTFRATGSKVKFPGFMKVYIEGSDDGAEEESFLPPIEEGQILEQKEIVPSQHFTQPPPRYSEARMLKTMEEMGIGRPSTYAPTMETIQKRGYVALEEKRFVPTELGEIVITLVEEFFPEILNVEFTAHMESGLDNVEAGNTNWVQVLDDFYHDFAKRVVVAEEEMKEVELKVEESDETCELCGRVMIYKLGRFGKFLACSGFPDCRNTKPIVKETGVKCPQCETGEIIERKSKKSRIFYGCNQYPECDFVSWDKPIARPCPKCASMLVEKKRKKQGVSINCTKCDYQEEADS